MQQIHFRDRQKPPTTWEKLTNRLIYLPGAAIILYGLWLSVAR